MFAPVLFPEDDHDHHHHHHHNNNNNNLVHPCWRGVPPWTAVVFKINNILFFLSLGVAAFVQFSTLEPRYLNALLWGGTPSSVGVEWDPTDTSLHDDHDTTLWFVSSSYLLLILRILQSLWTILVLCLLRVIVFPDESRQHDTVLEAVLGDMLFHIQCRLVIGFLVATCCSCTGHNSASMMDGTAAAVGKAEDATAATMVSILTNTRVSFDTIETVIVCGSIILQQLT